jgi:cell division protein ZipA
MPELRIILLIVGVLFVAGIAGFEWWRSRGQRPAATVSRGNAREDMRGNAREEPRSGGRDDEGPHGGRHEPSGATAFERSADREMRSLPEINVVREPRMAVQDSLPVIELASTSESGTRRALGIAISDDVAIDVMRETRVEDEPRREESEPEERPGERRPHAGHPREEPWIGPDGVSEVRVVPEPVSPETPHLTLVWPNEGERRIVTLRVVPKTEPRFPGRSLRQAFNGCGFWHGPMDIFHMPDEQGRVLVSAAALAQPGTFDPSIMDSQRFSGLNLFAVLPGPVPEREIFEELVHAARQLAERLGGLITDQHGEELTPERIARLRQSLESAPPAARAGQG